MSDIRYHSNASIRTVHEFLWRRKLGRNLRCMPLAGQVVDGDKGAGGIDFVFGIQFLKCIAKTPSPFLWHVNGGIPLFLSIIYLNDFGENLQALIQVENQNTFVTELLINCHASIFGCTIPFHHVVHHAAKDMTELINLTHNLDAFDLYPGSFTGKEFGGIMFEMHANEHAEVWDRLRTSDDPHEKAFAVYVERLETSLDLQKYGVHASRDDNGILTGNGYLLLPDEPLPEKYTGPKDIPAEHRLTAPSAEPDRKPSLLGQLAAAKEQAVDTARPDAPEKKAPSGPEL